MHAAQAPDRAAVIMHETGERVSYAELEDRSIRLSRLLYDAGLRPGDGIVLIAENDPRYFEVYWAALRSGLYFTAVNWHLTADESAHVVNDSGARALIVSAARAGLARDTPGVEVRLAFGGEVPGYGDYERELAATPPVRLEHEPLGTDMLYSSGTTGRPKGVRLPLRPVTVVDGSPMALGISAVWGFGPQTVYLSPAPLYHAAPLRYGAWVQMLGGTVVVLRNFDPQTALAAIEQHRVTHSQWVPTHFVRMLKLPDEVRLGFDHSSLAVAIHAAAPCPVHVKQAMIDWWGPVVHEYYAATESAGMTLIMAEEWLLKPGSVGRPVVGEVRICADDGTLLRAGQVGTVYFERDELPFRYHNDDTKTAQAQHPVHPTWTTTGDVGYLDADGYLFLTDRKSFVIISGGVNIYSQEVENCLTAHPDVMDVAVIGVPDEEMGESVLAVVQLMSGIVPGPELERELIAFARDNMAHYKAPRRVSFADQLPRTPAGKLRKHLLREKYPS
ncbi:MAG TPA: acyl-CoA synthetase [Streptosporangiaceae bacterium]